MSVQVWKINAVKELRQEFSNAYLEIWNHGDNLKFLSFTGQQFTGGQIGAWLDLYEAAGQAGAIAYHYFRQNGQIRGIIVISQNNLEGFEILGLGVHPQTKNQGIGTALLRSALQSARDAGYRAISAKVFADNASMQRLLLREDFLPVAIDNAKRYDGMALVNYHKSFRE